MQENAEKKKWPRPAWAIACNTELDKLGMSKRDLASAIHIHHTRISSTMSGNPKYADENTALAICTYLGVEYE